MPTHRSAAKRVRQNKKRQIKNRTVKSGLKIRMKKFNNLINDKKFPEAGKLLTELLSLWDKASSQKVIPKNRASRQKSRLTKRLNAAERRKAQ